MPHIKVLPLTQDELISRASEQKNIIDFVAKSITHNESLLSIRYGGEEFLLLYKIDIEEAMLKIEKLTRPLKLSLIKEAISAVALKLNLQILSSNIENTKQKKEPLFASNYYKKIEDFIGFQSEFKKIAIEIGFGSGRHILYQANQNPETLYIGLEIHTPSAQQLLKQIEIQKLQNIYVVNYDARLFLEMIPSNLISQIFVHFPVPWDKKPDRRVISDAFVNEANRVLYKGGTLELRTDSELYYRYALEVFSKPQMSKFFVQKNYALPIISKYEARWQRQEKNIYDVTMLCEYESEELVFEFHYNFDKMSYNVDKSLSLERGSHLFEVFFVNFERFYKIDESAVLIKCAFGSFARPEHKYILLQSDSCGYYQSLPIPSKANIQAHQKIKEFIYAKCC